MDNDLQIGLIGIGILLIVAIVAINKWQERKHRRSAEQAFSTEHRDVLLEDEPGVRREPVGGDDEPDEGIVGTARVVTAGAVAPSRNAAAPAVVATGSGLSSEPDVASQQQASKSARRFPPKGPEEVDLRADCVIRLESIEPLAAHALLEAQASLLGGLSKPVRWFGLDAETNAWQPIDAQSTGSYHWFCVAMQMVDRQGPISEAEFNSFCAGVRAAGERFMAVPSSLPNRAEILANATELDRFCASVDRLIGLNVIAAQPFAGTKLRGLIEAAGARLSGDGSFVVCDDDGHLQFTISDVEENRYSPEAMRSRGYLGVTLLIDVPRVRRGDLIFDRMLRCANTLAEALGASVVDDRRMSLGQEDSQRIRQQIVGIQNLMNEAGMPAGERLAMRLFAS